MKVFKMVVETGAIVPNPKLNRKEVLVVAETEKDARDSYNPSVTGLCGSSMEVLSCECLGEVSAIVDSAYKSHWNQDDDDGA